MYNFFDYYLFIFKILLKMQFYHVKLAKNG